MSNNHNNTCIHGFFLPHGVHRNQTNYIIEGTRWKNACCNNINVARPECGIDHKLLLCKFKVKLKWKKKANKLPLYDFEHIPKLFKKIRKCFEVMNLNVRESTELWNKIKEIVKDKCKKRPRIKKAYWMTEKIMEIVKKRREAKSKKDNNFRMELSKELQ